METTTRTLLSLFSVALLSLLSFSFSQSTAIYDLLSTVMLCKIRGEMHVLQVEVRERPALFDPVGICDLLRPTCIPRTEDSDISSTTRETA